MTPPAWADRYPPEILGHFDAVRDVVLKVLGEGRVAEVALFGSASRGELTFVQGGQGLELFSDYEVEVVVRRALDAATEEALHQALEALTEGFGVRGPLFHIDLSVVSVTRRLARAVLRRNVALKELELTRRVLYAARGWPRVAGRLAVRMAGGSARLDAADASDLIGERLWRQFEALRGVLDAERGGGVPEQLHRAVLYFARRNTLEAATVLAVHEGVFEPGYTARWQALRRQRAALEALGPDIMSSLERALDEKLHPTFEGTLVAAAEDFLAVFQALVAYLEGKGRLWPPLGPLAEVRRRRREAEVAGELGLSLAWTRRDKRPDELRMLLALNETALARLRGEGDDSGALDRLLQAFQALEWSPAEGVDPLLHGGTLVKAWRGRGKSETLGGLFRQGGS